MAHYPYLIVGGGMTADAAVRGIRELDGNRSIGLIGAEPDPPYARPPLSKGLWKGGARFNAPALGTRLRFEHEDNALTMGRAAGRAMAGDGSPYAHLPFFYSDLFDLGYEAVGVIDPRCETVADWKEPFREGVVYYLSEGRVRGVLLWNTWDQVDKARELIAQPGPWSATDLVGRLPA